MDIWARTKHAIAWRGRRVRKFLTKDHRRQAQEKARRQAKVVPTPPVIRNMVSIETGLIQGNFPIDIVYTWVDSADESFRELLAAHLPPGAETNKTTLSKARFACHEELRYSLRSIERYAPWYNHIYIVTNGQVPVWLRRHPKVTVVKHDQILAPEYLPTFNSHVIGSALHRIPGLSEHYIYFNDDVMLLRPIKRTDAFTETGLSYGFISFNQIGNGPPVPHETATEWGAKNARDLMLRDWGHWFDRRFTHMFHPQRRSVAEDCERRFAAEYDRFRRNRFRQPDDILCCSFLHHYVGYLTGRTLLARSRGWYVRVRALTAPRDYARLLAERAKPRGRQVVCLNDYLPPEGELDGYEAHLSAFLDEYFPGPSSFERPVEVSHVPATPAMAERTEPEPILHAAE